MNPETSANRTVTMRRSPSVSPSRRHSCRRPVGARLVGASLRRAVDEDRSGARPGSAPLDLDAERSRSPPRSDSSAGDEGAAVDPALPAVGRHDLGPQAPVSPTTRSSTPAARVATGSASTDRARVQASRPPAGHDVGGRELGGRDRRRVGRGVGDAGAAAGRGPVNAGDGAVAGPARSASAARYSLTRASSTLPSAAEKATPATNSSAGSCSTTAVGDGPDGRGARRAAQDADLAEGVARAVAADRPLGCRRRSSWATSTSPSFTT